MNATDQPPPSDRANCCVVGGGPAGVMLGFLLARAGVDVLVVEKHKDFFRDFRGDTIHPSTLELLYELGLLDEFLRLPHQELREVTAHFGPEIVHMADFTHLPTHCKFIAFMPQWDFLNFLSTHAKKYPNFRLRMETEVTDLIFEQERVVGVKANTPQGALEIRADLVVGADGRSSTTRERAGLEVIDLGAPIDALWFRLPKRPNDPAQAFGFVGVGQFMVLLDRADYWQCAYVIRKGSFDEKRARGLPAFRDEVARCAAFLKDRMDELKQWDDVKLLNVKVDHLRSWHREGLLCIGDSAHAMSPVGGVGINLAIQDAVATANLLAAKLKSHSVTSTDLQAVQNRRGRPARLTQRAQIFLHQHLLEPIFNSTEIIPPPLPMRLFEKYPRLRRIPARMVGIGFRPEHIRQAGK
ncbi:MAG TPA: FAD-dependent oxidoreductase [Verrucomicrobiae bacterium]|jgi:2-polyprenyl-6-methoxyphenol hydroxylase-like FAD-dependent oxidoreductase|nr:FAD-dependent oxidoreductase [Verrucomicrobiae bacterium]